ncbi:RCC1 domain-containing protein [Paenibacillus alba]|uniref:Chromosome condensation regulator n=1 Tax=Paenibacillus alba TaxID=1197127 RepID=A0ABU6FZT0_9BACL|nr:chromosome condensation regulator [Paenibacillus alba]MEC0226572.1 chromosome condensation regulator [Paenibacillus alba]
MKFNYWPKRMAQSTALLSVLSLSSVAPLTAIAADTSPKDQSKIVQLTDPRLAIDDQGDVWCLAQHAISVKDGFFPDLMVRATSITNVKSIASGGGSTLALKNDGTVWTVELNSRTATIGLKDTLSATLGERIPHLENIVKIDVFGSIGLALDKEGKAWIFETAPSWVRNDPSTSLKSEPVLLEGLDHIKDMSFSYDVTFLKEDGTVWNIDEYSPRPSSNWSLYDSIRYSKPVQLKNLKDIVQLESNHYAIKKDGTVWTWGRTIISKENLGPALTPVAPYQIEELSDVVDIASSNDHSLFVKKDGTVWGRGYFVEKWEALGATPQNAWKDLSKLDGFEDAASIHVSINGNSLSTESVIKKDGTVWMWGLDQFQNLDSKPRQVEFRK